MNQIRNVGQMERFIEMDEIGFDFAGAHEVDAGKENAVDVCADGQRFGGSGFRSWPQRRAGGWVPRRTEREGSFEAPG